MSSPKLDPDCALAVYQFLLLLIRRALGILVRLENSIQARKLKLFTAGDRAW